jgi:hypothetical protein
MRPLAGTRAGAVLAVLALTACKPDTSVGYVELKTVPVLSLSQPTLYLDSVKLEPLRKGTAVLRQRVGTAKLQIEGGGGQLAPLCEIVVKKNRITTVTVSVLDRPPRCQCRGTGTDRSANRTCLS